MDYIALTRMDIELERKLVKKYSTEVERLPHGRMCCKISGGYKRYYLVEGGKQKYLSDKTLIEKLKTRRLLEKTIEIMEDNIKIQEKLLSKYKLYDYKSVHDNLPGVYQNGEYLLNRGGDNPENHMADEKIHRTTFGLKVRSKSEALIAEVLHGEGINFKYEKTLNLINEKGRVITVHPDFTVYTKAGHKVIWEHFGMMSIPEYRKDALRKIAMYYDNGITIPDRLVITMVSQRCIRCYDS